MSVAEYRDKFAQLSRYAPNDVAEDREKQRRFLKGLYDGLAAPAYVQHIP